MEIEFIANKVTYELSLEEDCYIVGFSDNGDDPDQYVILQRAKNFKEQDIEMGIDSYYFEYLDQHNSGYNVLESIEFNENCIIFNVKYNLFNGINKIKVVFGKDAIESWDEFAIAIGKIFSKE